MEYHFKADTSNSGGFSTITTPTSVGNSIRSIFRKAYNAATGFFMNGC